ncbi:DUF6049 family protein [Actinomadura sp. 9N215]|uniref:DUF6049 family protein n=1 Tax=Actinomadura sp. 9N215 TaxID=3375150 RepID=UPI0037AF5659
MRTVKRAVALAALLPCIAMAAPATLASPATAAARKAPEAAALARQRAPVGLALTKVDPKPVRENSRIEISGLAKNRTDDQLAGLTMRLRYSAQPVLSRSQLDQYSAGQPSLLPNIAPQQLPLTGVATPGKTQGWTFKTTTKALQLRPPGGTPGVYPVGVEVLNSAQQVVGGLMTFLTFMPKQRQFNPVEVSWVWPLIDRMHRTNDQTFFDDQLTTEMSRSGRLGKLVNAAAGSDTPVTWAMDPALLDDVQQMASGDYTVKPFGGKRTEKEKSAVAASWLAALKNAAKSDPYFTVPYGDPDVVALVRHKTPRDIGVALDERNTGVATKVLGRPADAHVAWPPYGVAGPGTLGQLAKHSLKDGGTFLMSSSQFQAPPPGTPPNATTTLQTNAGRKNAVLYDDKLSQIVSKGTASTAGAALAEQRFLAETAMIAAETPNLKRTVVVAPDRHWNPAPGFAEKLLSYTKNAPWLRETPLAKAESAAPQGRVFNGYNDDYEAFELSDAHLTQTREIARQAATFQAIMTGEIKISYERALLRLQSVAWRTMPGRAKAARRELARELGDDMDRVRIVTTKNKRVLMGGSSGKLPVLVENTLSDQSVRVRLVAVPTSESRSKLRLGALDPDEAVINLRPGERAQRWIPAKAAGNGNFHVRLELMIPESGGRTFGSGETITVRTTGYGRLALVITGGGLAVLFVGVGVRAIRARRRRNSEAGGDGSTEMGPAGTAEQGNGYAGPGLPGPGPRFPDSGFPGPGSGFSGPASGTSASGPGSPGPAPGYSSGFAEPASGFAEPGLPNGGSAAAPGPGLPGAEPSSGPGHSPSTGLPGAGQPPGSGVSDPRHSSTATGHPHEAGGPTATGPLPVTGQPPGISGTGQQPSGAGLPSGPEPLPGAGPTATSEPTTSSPPTPEPAAPGPATPRPSTPEPAAPGLSGTGTAEPADTAEPGGISRPAANGPASDGTASDGGNSRNGGGGGGKHAAGRREPPGRDGD